MKDTEVKRMLREDEGTVFEVYADTEGNLTCGVGHLLAEGSKVNKAICHIFFKDDYYKAKKDTVKFLTEFNIEIDKTRRGVLICLVFNMGVGSYSKKTGLKSFRNMILALQDKDYDTAGMELKDSRWYNIDVGRKRGDRMVDILTTGENPYY
ncbi:MAG: hypothetical protein KAS32_10975 [Candidatus Peribacteraceae bacterium]|nr:hypothetical protein [Candidatus Peribacteraceae bacterium]